MGFYITNIFYTDIERERERERERENMFWVFGSRSVRQAEKCLVLFSLSKDYLGS